MKTRTVNGRTVKKGAPKGHVFKNREVLEEVEVLGELLAQGREFKVDSKRSYYVFRSFVIPAEGEPWVEAVEKNGVASRSFHLSRITKVVPLPKQRKKKASVVDES